MHGNTTCLPIVADPNARRIAELSAEWFAASPKRQQEIGVEITAIIEGKVGVLQ